MLRAIYWCGEILQTFENEPRLGGVSVVPSLVSGTFRISVDSDVVWDRKVDGGFPEVKALKQRIRDRISPERSLGHSEK